MGTVKRHPLRDTRRTLRAHPTPQERKLWDCLRKRRLDGFRFRRQHSIGNYIVDFYCPAARLAIEIDGGGHTDFGQIDRDSDRDRQLKALNIRVLRFWNSQIEREMESALDTIARELARGE